MQGLEETLRAALVNGKLPCAQAFTVANEHGLTPYAVGKEVDQIGIRISRCQLGLFGRDTRGKQRGVKPAVQASAALAEAIKSRLVVGKVPCIAAWEIAAAQTVAKRDVADAIEALGLHISGCQLGCFP
ncbi:hypothetical protein LR032_04500 [Candidatus Bipolaricaulota bacterium]|nr:hypothetical protein [Candidatus Bipolaricaulota bacterium]